MIDSNSLKKYSSILIGSAILALGMSNIHARSYISEGGVLGLSLLIYNWFHISPGIVSFILDFSAFILGSALIRKSFLMDSIFASACYSICYLIYTNFNIYIINVSNSPLLSCILGGIFVGVGVGIIVRQDCAAGGDDALALICNHKFNLRVSQFYVVSDFIVLALSLSYIPLNHIVWSFISVLISSFIIETLRKKQ